MKKQPKNIGKVKGVKNRNWITENLDEYLRNALIQEKKIKLRIKMIKQIKKLREENKMTLSEIGKRMGTTKQNISLILKKIK